MVEQNRQQQTQGYLANRSFGEQQTNISMRREEYDLRLSQAERNVLTLTGRALDTAEYGTGLVVGNAARVVTTPAHAKNEIGINNTTTDARESILRDARGSHIENYEAFPETRLFAWRARLLARSDRLAFSDAQFRLSAAKATLLLAVIEGTTRRNRFRQSAAFHLPSKRLLPNQADYDCGGFAQG